MSSPFFASGLIYVEQVILLFSVYTPDSMVLEVRDIYSDRDRYVVTNQSRHPNFA